MTTSAPAAPSKGLHIGLWVAQALCAFAFTGSGLLKLTSDLAELGAKMAWVPKFPALAVRGIGFVEVLGAIGLILPSALRIQPQLTVWAAMGLTLVMLGAASTHVVLGEPQMMVPSLVLAALSAFIVWGRGSKAPIAPK
jgi:putative oxidoreductase